MTQNTTKHNPIEPAQIRFTYLLKAFHTDKRNVRYYGVYDTNFRLLAMGYGEKDANNKHQIKWLASDLYPEPLHEFLIAGDPDKAENFYRMADDNNIATISVRSIKPWYHVKLTPVNVCNAVLCDILDRNKIDRLYHSVGTAEQKACYYDYYFCVGDVLSRGAYKFAIKQTTLKVDDTGYVTLPTNCIRVLKLVGDKACPGKRSREVYSAVTLASMRREEVRDSDTAELTYVYDNRDPEQFTPDFVCALVQKLAIALVNSLSMVNKAKEINDIFDIFNNNHH